jgi:hypothetical protein
MSSKIEEIIFYINKMESNSCICIGNILKQLESMLNALLHTTGNVMLNTNTPSTDSGYVTSNGSTLNRNINTDFGSTSIWNINNVFYGLLLVLAAILFFSKFKNGFKNKSSFK